MAARTKFPFDEELEKLEVLVLRDFFIKVWKDNFQWTLRRSRDQTLRWLTAEYRPELISSFKLPLGNVMLRDFRRLYVQSFELGLGHNRGVPTGILYLRAGVAADLFVTKIEADLKRIWKRQISRDVRLKQTIEVFNNALS